MTYKEAINWLYNQFPSFQEKGAVAYKPGLENMLALCEAFHNPQDQLKFIHVGGTNGKGSTCSMLASILKESGETVGLFTSPHIIHFTERIRINGAEIDEDFILEIIAEIRSKKFDFKPSFFEITFLIALMYFQQRKCSICIIEVGLGGRLDATNIISPLISLITNISIDHVQFLGNTIESIATEKAGIIKENTPVVISEYQSSTKKIFSDKAISCHAPIQFVDHDSIKTPTDFPLLGQYQKFNYGLVLTALNKLTGVLRVLPEHIHDGLKNLHANTGYFGRLQLVQENPSIIYDVSHNIAGIADTLKFIHSYSKGKVHIVYGTSADKNFQEIFELFPKEYTYYFTEFSNERSAKKDDFIPLAEKNKLNATFFFKGEEALKSAQHIANKEDTILVFGSFFLLADFF